MTCFTTRHIQGGGWGQHFSTLRAPKLMTYWAPRVFNLLDTPLGIGPLLNLLSSITLFFCFAVTNYSLFKKYQTHFKVSATTFESLCDQPHQFWSWVSLKSVPNSQATFLVWIDDKIIMFKPKSNARRTFYHVSWNLQDAGNVWLPYPYRSTTHLVTVGRNGVQISCYQFMAKLSWNQSIVELG